jgi:hypothetical protein
MGFDYNPYVHVEAVWVDDGANAGWVWHCHNCGGRGSHPICDEEPLATLVSQWKYHLRSSHGSDPIDFEGWGDGT